MLSKQDKEFLERYQAGLKRPKWRFILLHALGWTVITVVLTTAVDLLVKEPITKQGLLSRFLVQLVFGFVYGWYFRWYLGRRTKKIEEKQLSS